MAGMLLDDFVKKYEGKKVDFDGVYGPQCFLRDHCVLMSDWTYKPIQDVKVGDRVIGYDNALNTVTKIFQSEKDVVHIKTDLSDIYVTPDHPFYFMSGEFLPAVNMTEKRPALFDKENFKKSGLTDNELLFLGFWLGDGNVAVHKDNRTPEIRITYGFKKADFVHSLGIISSERAHQNTDNAFVASIRKQEHEKLSRIIIESCSGEYKRLPLIFTNREYGLILRGLIQADGSRKHGSYVITNTSLPLLMSVQAMLIKLGYKTKSIRLSKRNSDRIRIKGKLVKSVKPLYRLTVTDESKKGTSFKAEILEGFKAEVFNLETDNTHTYICNNYKVHNCVDLFRQYCEECLNIKEHTGPCSTTGGAKDLYLDYEKMPIEKKYFTRIPKNKAFVPGDTLIWDSTETNKYGHVAIYLGKLNNLLIVFEQDGFKQDGAKINLRSKTNLLGFLRKK